jgi:hypothetical protein
MPETPGVAGPCRSLFAQRTSPRRLGREKIPHHPPDCNGITGSWHFRLFQ